MGNILRTATAFLVGICIMASPTAGQEQPASITRSSWAPIDEWLSTPHPIELSPKQGTSLAEIKDQFRVDFENLPRGDELELVLQSRTLLKRYVTMVRRVLTPAQQLMFDRNVRQDLRIGGM